MAIVIRVQKLPHGEGLHLPAYQSDGAAGMDLQAAVSAETPVVLQPGQRALIPTGLAFELPRGFEAQVRPRSGLAVRDGVTVLNSPGTIDADYRGEIKVLLINHGQEPFIVERGDRVAQLVVQAVARAQLRLAVELASSERGAGGFGSTGR
jgi:dUTP pyrophosphatase